VVLVAWAKCRAAVNIIQILGDVDLRTRSGSYTYLLVCLHCILASLNRCTVLKVGRMTPDGSAVRIR